MVEVMKTMVTAFKRSHAGTFTPVPPILQQATTNLCLHQRLLDPHGQVWVPAPFSWSWCTQDSVCALQESVSQSCVSPGSSMVGLMVVSKRAGAIPRSTAPRAPAPTAVHSGVSCFKKTSLVDLPGGTVDTNPPAHTGDMGSIPGPRRFYMQLSQYGATTESTHCSY